MQATNTFNKRFKPFTAISIGAIHLGALAAVMPYFFSWTGLVLCLVLIWLTASLGVSLSYHRMLSHRAWRARPWLRNILTFLACLSLEMGPISWSATHRQHHRESDHEADPHSPLVNFFWAHLGWLFFTHPVVDDESQKRKLVPDLYNDSALRFFEQTFFLHWIVFAIVSMAVGYAFGGLQLALSLFVWGSLVRTVWVWHATWCVNSVTHLFGYRNYKTPDDSRNLWWVALVTFGEGWHNNHHALAGSANFGHKWFEFDPSYWALALFNRLGWVERVNHSPRLHTSSPMQQLTGHVIAQSKALRSALRQPSIARMAE
jgi:sn-2 palmitoyl-lipid 9-desaturase